MKIKKFNQLNEDHLTYGKGESPLHDYDRIFKIIKGLSPEQMVKLVDLINSFED